MATGGFDMGMLSQLLGNKELGTTITSAPGQTEGMMNFKLPMGTGDNTMQANPMLSPENLPMQPNQALAPGAAGSQAAPQSMMDRFGNYMGSNQGKALTYNLANILGAMGGGTMGNLAQTMAQGGMYGLRQEEMAGRQDANQNRVLSAILGNKPADFR